MRRAFLALLGVLALVPAVHGESAGLEHEWHGIYLAGRKIGWSHRVTGPVRLEGRAYVTMRLRVRTVSKAAGIVTTSHVESERLYDARPPHALVRAWRRARRGDSDEARVDIRRHADGYGATLPPRGSVVTLTAADVPTLADERAVAAWARRPRAVGDTMTHRTLDLSRMVVNAVTVAITGVSQGRYEMSFRSKQGGEGRMRYDRQGRLIWMRSMGLVELHAESPAAARSMPRPVDVMRPQYARVDKPLGPAPNVRGLILRARGPGAEHVRSGPRQDARYDPRTRVLTLRLGARSGAVKASEAERADALAETPRYPANHRVVKALAEETVAGAADDAERVKRLVDFVDDLIVDAGASQPLTVLDILEVQEGDCTEHALLFATLARAAGIPAREVTGLVYLGDEERAFGPHAWNEVVIDGHWVPVDPTLGQAEIDATHIRRDLAGSGRPARMALAGATLELVSIRRNPVKRPRAVPRDPSQED